MDRWGVGVRNEAATAAGFIHANCADGHALFGFEDALGIVGWLTTLHADGVSLGNVFGDGEELRHRFPGFAGVVLIQSGDNYSDAQPAVDLHHQHVVKNLPIVNADRRRRHAFSAHVFKLRTGDKPSLPSNSLPGV